MYRGKHPMVHTFMRQRDYRDHSWGARGASSLHVCVSRLCKWNDLQSHFSSYNFPYFSFKSYCYYYLLQRTSPPKHTYKRMFTCTGVLCFHCPLSSVLLLRQVFSESNIQKKNCLLRRTPYICVTWESCFANRYLTCSFLKLFKALQAVSILAGITHCVD